MPLAVNGRFLSQNLTGVQRVALQYSQELVQAFPQTKVFTVPSPIQKVEAEALGAQELPSPKPHHIFWEQWALPRAARGSFLLNFGNTGPVFYKNQALMIHDTAFIERPQWFSKSFASYYRLIVPQAARSARFVMTVSQFSKGEIIHHLGIPEEKILVLPLWASPVFQAMSSQAPEQKEDYALAVASIEPRKNYPALLRAFSRISGIRLKAAGGASGIFASDPMLSFLANQPHVELLGRCGDAQLCSLYEKALFFCSLSFYEGFGLPPLEAMNAGCPLLLSDIPAHREVCGSAALYADPYDDEDIFQKLRLIKETPSLRQELALAGKERAAFFSKEKSLELFYSRLKSVLG